MDHKSTPASCWQQAIDFGIDVTLLEANLALTPAQRLRELVAMNRLHEQLQARTLTPAQRSSIDARELELKFGALTGEPWAHDTARTSAD